MDGHDHGQGYRSRRTLRLAFALTVLILVVEATAGVLSGSLALLSDAGHILTDVLALGLAWFAVTQASRPADARRTYGYHRVGILTAMANGTVLIVIVGAILYEAVGRFLHPHAVDGVLVLVSASVAIAVNLFIALRLRGSGKDLNTRAARIHVVGDLAASVGVVVAAIIILTTGWQEADPLISVGIAAVIAWGALRIVVETVNILLEGTPKGIDIDEVHAAIAATPGVQSVHDLHVWSLAAEQVALSAHIVGREGTSADGEHLVRAVEETVCQGFGISHTTVQLETCHPCEDSVSHDSWDHNHPHAAPVDRFDPAR